MSRFDRKKIAVTLAFASLFGSKTSAINSKSEVKSPQTLGAVREETSRINSTTNKKSLPVWVKGLISLFGGAGFAAEVYNEVISLSMGEKPKTLLTGKYSITELVRSMNKKKKPDEQQQHKNKKIYGHGYKPEEKNKKTESKKSYKKGLYFEENTKKFVKQFSTGDQHALNGFKEFQRQVLELGVDGMIANNVIKDSDTLNAKDVSKEDETLRQTLEIACSVISGQVSMNMSNVVSSNPYYVKVESKAGNFCIYSSINDCGFELHDASKIKVFSFSNIKGN